MSAVTPQTLDALYARTGDPWRHRTSDYEAAKYAATLAALPRGRYAAILELGCGNGELARRLATRCERYVGVDAVERALVEARRAVPTGSFHRLYLPAALPAGTYGLIVLSEVLYFLDAPEIAAVAHQLATRWPAAELLCVNWLGPSGNDLSGARAFALFADALPRTRTHRAVVATRDYRIDRFVPERVALERVASERAESDPDVPPDDTDAAPRETT